MVKLEPRAEDVDRSKTERRLKMFSDNREGILYSMNRRDPVKTFLFNNETPPREVLHEICSYVQKCLDRLAKTEQIGTNRSSKIPQETVPRADFWSWELCS